MTRRTKIKENFSVNNVSQENYEIREEQYQGKTHIVVPVVMMVEGVHHGSHGPLLHPIEELGKFPGAWDGIPVTIDHPSIDGENVSANSPSVLDARSVGRVFNTHVEDTRLIAEVWVEKTKLNNVSPETLVNLQNKEIIEVSVGVFSEDDDETGEWNGEEYTAIARNHRPDHLALLPGGTGACSVDDGCGIRANKKGGTMTDLKVMKENKDKGYSVYEILDNLSEGLQERLELLRRKIDSLDSNDSVHYLQEAYDDYVVYEVRQRIGSTTKLYKQNYQVSTAGVELTDNAVEVLRKVEYVNINKSTFVRKSAVKKEGNVETNEVKASPCVVTKVNALIANKLTAYSEEDRGWLEKMDLPQLEKMDVQAPAAIENNSSTVQVLTDEQKRDLTWAKNERLARRNSMIGVIQANTSKEIWPDATLAAMDEDTLGRVFNSVKKKEEETADYSMNLNSQSSIQDNSKEEILLPTGIILDK